MNDLIIKPVDPDVTNSYMYLDMNWYTQNKLPGFSFMIRAKNEEKNIGKCLQSIIDNLPSNIPYELIVINNNSEDETKNISQSLIKPERGDRVVDYPYVIAKPGIENYYTPINSVHSFVYFSQFCLMQCKREFCFRWDADFEMTEKLGKWMQMVWNDHLLKQQHNRPTLVFILVPATDQDHIVNAEMYLFQTRFRPYFYRRHIWEQTAFENLDTNKCLAYKAKPDEALILHQSTLKIIKKSYFDEPWWQTKLKNSNANWSSEYLSILNQIEDSVNQFKSKISSEAQTFCRSMDPKPVELIKVLPLTEDKSFILDKLNEMRKNGLFN